ncbi:zinc ribbon domain-containing protein [Lentibacillus cibarius]|uniref:Zinc ribbon domain-containing protein n=1 Tax=Lentibacillus cibarius TaxID=2583219 RepID=A0A549YEC7_9BACI|nr:zinc ribbon domain-containing protein [Lentibacillus cibarius]TMN21370.1 zinc ribbon domain-containing protein [Lentibacillus cibarius]TRM10249.1 zinc ribbon domain-containing protein [Lentibacillus cibarius]
MKKNTDQKQQIDELTTAKSKLLIELGQEVYMAYRLDDKITPIVEEKGEAIRELDVKLYDLLKEKGKTKSEGPTCSCGALLTKDDLFCPECGKKVKWVDNTAEMVVCQSCAKEVPADADFCPVCGMKMAKSRPNG